MARIRIIEDARRVGGWLSGEYENDYVVTKDDDSCSKTFTTYEEAQIYRDYLQRIENEERLLLEQIRTADETAALRKAVENQNKLAATSKLPPLTHRPVHDPEYAEFLMWKREQARKDAQEKLMREQQRKDFESKERTRLYGVAQNVDKGMIPYNNDVSQILYNNVFVFTNPAVILMIAENARYNYEFSVLIRDYGKVKGVYEKLLHNTNLVSCPYEIKALALANINTPDFIAEMFLNDDLRSKCADYPIFFQNDIEILKLLKRRNLLKDYNSDYTNWADDIILAAEKRKEKETETARLKAELIPIEDALLNKEKLPLKDRVKVAKNTYRENVMMKCANDSAKTVREALKLNPNITDKVLAEIKKRETHIAPQGSIPTANYATRPIDNTDNDNGRGCLLIFILINIVGAIVYFATH